MDDDENNFSQEDSDEEQINKPNTKPKYQPKRTQNQTQNQNQNQNQNRQQRQPRQPRPPRQQHGGQFNGQSQQQQFNTQQQFPQQFQQPSQQFHQQAPIQYPQQHPQQFQQYPQQFHQQPQYPQQQYPRFSQHQTHDYPRTFLYIDAGYIAESTKKRNIIIDYVKFVQKLEELLNCKFIERWFFTSSEKTHDVFLNWMRSPAPNGPHFRVKVHSFKPRTCEHCQKQESVQRGVDVSLVTQILKASIQNLCDRFVFVTGDGDFEESLRISIEEFKKEFVIVGFNDKSISAGIAQYAKEVLYLDNHISSVLKTGKSDGSKPDFGKPIFGKPDPEKPDFGKPDFGKPIFGKPEFNTDIGKTQKQNQPKFPKPNQPTEPTESKLKSKPKFPKPNQPTEPTEPKPRIKKSKNQIQNENQNEDPIPEFDNIQFGKPKFEKPTPTKPTQPTQPTKQPVQHNEPEITWECEVCETHNTLDQDVCRDCGWEAYPCHACTMFKKAPKQKCSVCETEPRV